jgi:hypothetical protein
MVSGPTSNFTRKRHERAADNLGRDCTEWQNPVLDMRGFGSWSMEASRKQLWLHP